MNRIAGAAVLALLCAPVTAQAQAQEQERLQCPAHANTTLARVLYLFSTEKPETFATCIYADGSEETLTLRKGCRLAPVDAVHDGAPKGGMAECRETAPNRCHIECAAS